MAESTIWWLLAGAAVGVELITGTFYLLMLAFGMAAGALAAHLGAPLPLQLVAAAAVGGGAVVAWYLLHRNAPARARAEANRDVNLDVGETVQVDHWAADGTGTVKYRGAQWTVVYRGAGAPDAGRYRVAEVMGNRLLVEKA